MPETICQVSFVGMDGVDAVRVEVRSWLVRLGALMDGVTKTHVLVEAIEENRKEQQYRVRMDLTLADGGVVVVTHDHPSNASHDDVYVAVRNAFRAARRQLEALSKARTVLAVPSTGDVMPIVTTP